MNPPDKKATPGDRARFERKLSGPIMDRIDLWVHVDSVSYEDLGTKSNNSETTSVYVEKVLQARKKQAERLEGVRIKLNSEMSVIDIDNLITLSQEVRVMLNDGAKRLNLSARSYHRIIKLARTIADLEGIDDILVSHILEAFQFRPKIEY